MKKFFLIFCAFALSGCVATAPQLKLSEAPDLSKFGVVLMPVTDRALFVATGGVVKVRSSAGEEILLRSDAWEEPIKASDGKGNKFYSAHPLAPGNYEVTGWGMVKTEGGIRKKIGIPFAFEIKAGQVVYVGNLNIVRPIDNAQFRQDFEVDLQKYRSLYAWMKNADVKHSPAGGEWFSPRKN